MKILFENPLLQKFKSDKKQASKLTAEKRAYERFRQKTFFEAYSKYETIAKVSSSIFSIASILLALSFLTMLFIDILHYIYLAMFVTVVLLCVLEYAKSATIGTATDLILQKKNGFIWAVLGATLFGGSIFCGVNGTGATIDLTSTQAKFVNIDSLTAVYDAKLEKAAAKVEKAQLLRVTDFNNNILIAATKKEQAIQAEKAQSIAQAHKQNKESNEQSKETNQANTNNLLIISLAIELSILLSLIYLSYFDYRVFLEDEKNEQQAQQHEQQQAQQSQHIDLQQLQLQAQQAKNKQLVGFAQNGIKSLYRQCLTDLGKSTNMVSVGVCQGRISTYKKRASDTATARVKQYQITLSELQSTQQSSLPLPNFQKDYFLKLGGDNA